MERLGGIEWFHAFPMQSGALAVNGEGRCLTSLVVELVSMNNLITQLSRRQSRHGSCRWNGHYSKVCFLPPE
jgi:hypothetical protein